MKFLKNEKGTFVIDILILLPLVFGPLIVYLATRHIYRWFGRRKLIIPFFSGLVIKGFWLAAGGLYFDYWKFGFLSKMSGNEFMWNWPFDLLGWRLAAKDQIPTYADFYGFWNILACFLFLAVYPLALWVGIQIGYLLFGRSERQKGIAALFFPVYKSHFK